MEKENEKTEKLTEFLLYKNPNGDIKIDVFLQNEPFANFAQERQGAQEHYCRLLLDRIFRKNLSPEDPHNSLLFHDYQKFPLRSPG